MTSAQTLHSRMISYSVLESQLCPAARQVRHRSFFSVPQQPTDRSIRCCTGCVAGAGTQEGCSPDRRQLLLGLAAAAAAGGWMSSQSARAEQFSVTHSDAEWRQLLTPAQYGVLRKAGTELPFSSPLNKEYREGTFQCGGCGSDVFSSSAKFNSGTGWPSFFEALPGAVNETQDNSIPFLPRTEVTCRACSGHLGHVFSDGPKPTGLRYCMNGVAMKFTHAAGSA